MLDYAPKRIRVGGLRLAANKAASTQRSIQPSFIPRELILPVAGAPGDTVRITVEPGERVYRGQPVARSAGAPSVTDIHASTSGRVKSIERRLAPAGSELRESLCVVVETDGQDTADETTNRWAWPADRETRLEALRAAGIVGLGGAAYPTSQKIDSSPQCKVLMINGAECEPYISCDDMLMRESARQIVAGCQLLRELTAAALCIIAIETDKPEAIDAIRAAVEEAAEPTLRVTQIPSIYPAGGERQLIEIVTGQQVPSGGYPSDIDYVCLNVGTAYAVYRLAEEATPLISRIVTVTGGGVGAQQNIDVLIGTPIAELIEHCGGYREGVAGLIVGGSMMGIALPNDAIPVTKSTNCVIAALDSEIDSNDTQWPCIRCADCADVCPVRLQPQDLLRAAKSRDFDSLERLALTDCIECGCCDVVCPSHIALTQAFVEAKRDYQSFGREHDLTDRAFERFQQRERRQQDRAAHGEAEQTELRSRLGTSRADKAHAIEEAVKRAANRRARLEDSN